MKMFTRILVPAIVVFAALILLEPMLREGLFVDDH